MKRHALVGVVLLLAVAALGAQAPANELHTLEHEWNVAFQTKHVAFLKKLLADEYLGTDSDGNVYTKAQELANVKEASITSVALSEMTVRGYGDTAVVTGVKTMHYTLKRKEVVGPFRFTDVFVRRDGRWQVVASQVAKVAKK